MRVKKTLYKNRFKISKKIFGKKSPNIWGGRIVKKNFWKKLTKSVDMLLF